MLGWTRNTKEVVMDYSTYYPEIQGLLNKDWEWYLLNSVRLIFNLYWTALSSDRIVLSLYWTAFVNCVQGARCCCWYKIMSQSISRNGKAMRLHLGAEIWQALMRAFRRFSLSRQANADNWMSFKTSLSWCTERQSEITLQDCLLRCVNFPHLAQR